MTPGPAGPRGAPLAVEMRGIRKAFPGVLANDGVDFSLAAGEVHGLLGENGAGKSTLMSILTGIYRPDAGEIRVGGRPVVMGSPRVARALGLAMVHQHFVQSERHTTLENIVLGWQGLGWWPDWPRLRHLVDEAAGRFGLRVDLDAPLWSLPVGERQKVEIVRALFQGAQILVLDEPTAVLSRQETHALFQVLRRFAAQGGAVVFISHKLDEVREICHRVTILRRGRSVAVHPIAAMDEAGLASLMVGHALDLRQRDRDSVHQLGPEVVRLASVTVAGPRGLPALEDVSLAVHGGEILGLAGVAGSGQRELADVLAGLTPPSSGQVLLGGVPAPPGPAAFGAQGVAYVPEDRLGTGSAGALSLTENLVLRNYASHFSRWGLLRWGQARRWAEGRIAAHDIQCPGAGERAANLSGGNLQKVILARELASEPRLLVAAYPCRGLDVGAAEEVRGHLLAARDRGAAVVLFSEDLDEILRLADHIGVLFRGRLLAVLPREQASREGIGLLMGGATRGVQVEPEEAGSCP